MFEHELKSKVYVVAAFLSVEKLETWKSRGFSKRIRTPPKSVI